jgi:hypothetical protein
LSRDVIDNECSDEHANSHKCSTTGERHTATKSLSQYPDKKGTSNDLDSTKQTSQQHVTVRSTARNQLEILWCENRQCTATRGILKNEQQRPNNEAESIGWFEKLSV